MKLLSYKEITQAFGDDAKWIELSNIGLKGIIFISSSNKVSHYDEKHLGRFISTGIYQEFFKTIQKEIGLENRIVIKVEYAVLKICVIRKGKDQLSLLKCFSVGLFYGRSLNVILAQARKVISETLSTEILTKSTRVKYFFELFRKDELNSEFRIEESIKLFEKISGIPLIHREHSLIKKYIEKNL